MADVYIGYKAKERTTPKYILDFSVCSESKWIQYGIKIQGGAADEGMFVRLPIFLLCDFLMLSVFQFHNKSSKECNDDVDMKQFQMRQRGRILSLNTYINIESFKWATEEVNNFKMREGKYVNVTHTVCTYIRFIESTAKTISHKQYLKKRKT